MVRRPVRPVEAYRPGEGLRLNPAGTTRRHTKYTLPQIAEFVAGIKDISPDRR